MSITQTESGKAFEYAIANSISKITNKEIVNNTAFNIAKAAYEKHNDKQKDLIDQATNKSSEFLAYHDPRLDTTQRITLKDDKEGKIGDVRDVVITIHEGEIGISAKNNHKAVKHSRLSDKIDFGKKWADCPCSSTYWKRIKPVFNDMREKKAQKIFFRDIPNKETIYYLPILIAFEDELRHLCEEFRQPFVKKVFQYLLGEKDFYKVIKEKSIVSVQSVNINGTLKWGKKWKIPEKIETIKRVHGSLNTLLVSFSGGWQLSFRIHNASSRVEPSLKFDINFVALPQNVAQHQIPLKSI